MSIRKIMAQENLSQRDEQSEPNSVRGVWRRDSADTRLTNIEKALIATMAAVLAIVAVALLSLPIPPDGPGAYADELPNPSRLTLDDDPVYEPDCQVKILSRLKK